MGINDLPSQHDRLLAHAFGALLESPAWQDVKAHFEAEVAQARKLMETCDVSNTLNMQRQQTMIKTITEILEYPAQRMKDLYK